MNHKKILKIDGTSSSPTVLLDGVNGFIKFSGKSLVTNAKEFYKPVLNWIAKYLKKPQTRTVMVYNMDATNTSFEKLILGIIIDIVFTLRNPYKFEFQWYYKNNDEFGLEYGQDFKSILNEQGILLNPTDFQFVEH